VRRADRDRRVTAPAALRRERDETDRQDAKTGESDRREQGPFHGRQYTPELLFRIWLMVSVC